MYHYSNANYIVLGAILQRITHRTLGALIDDRIIRPLHLERTLYGPDDLQRANAITFHGLYDVFGTGTPDRYRWLPSRIRPSPSILPAPACSPRSPTC